jgi:tetratricopeptide repeat protein 8
LGHNPTNVEALASIAGNCFYTDQPEVALDIYRRLIQMNIEHASIWCNLGLSAFYAQQFDLVLVCFEHAFHLATDDEEKADIWYASIHLHPGS